MGRKRRKWNGDQKAALVDGARTHDRGIRMQARLIKNPQPSSSVDNVDDSTFLLGRSSLHFKLAVRSLWRMLPRELFQKVDGGLRN
jgi:hypothetical protein